MPVSQTTYIDVLLAVAVPNLYTYHLDGSTDPKNLEPGMRVCVQFGKRKLHTALIIRIHNTPPEDYKTKEIIAVLDDYPVIKPWQINFWSWVAEYYMCTRGEVYAAALPAGLRPEGQTRIYPEEIPGDGITFSASEELIYAIVSNSPGLTIEELQQQSGKKQVMNILRDMQNKGTISFEELLREDIKAKEIELVTLHPNLRHENILNELINKLERRAPKQMTALMAYMQICGYLTEKKFEQVNKQELTHTAKVSGTVIKSMIDKEFFIVEKQEVSRLIKKQFNIKELATLNPNQDKALKEIRQGHKISDVVLLHGVTSSGKTEIYIHLIKEQIEQGKQVLYLLPEIALTTQIITRLQNIFGDKVGVYHSKFNNAERVEIWNNLLGKTTKDRSEYKIILGVRSSLFLPFENLGLIIVDEEHENTYKQFDPAPRYHARDTAVVLAAMHKAKVLMGTATPSLESYLNAKMGKYVLVELLQRHLDIQLPEVQIINVREARRKKKMNANFSPQLIEQIQTALKQEEQVILFQNRRGFSPYLECEDCGWIPECIHCDVSLTYHKGINKLVCHYCGFSMNSVIQCKACGGNNVQTRGFGTEKIEDDIKILFPDVKVGRMDLDSTRKKKAYEEIIEKFATGQIDILIGTQMVSKGLDFDNVSIVGILNADNMLNYPDFRASERSFQLMSQVSGRAGRKKKQGKVIIQTSDASNEIIQQVVKNDYITFFRNQFKERKQFNYPPFYRLINLTIRHKQRDILNKAAWLLAKELRERFGQRVLGPEAPAVSRIQNWHIKKLILKLEKTQEIKTHKAFILQVINNLKAQPGFSSLQVLPDVDFY